MGKKYIGRRKHFFLLLAFVWLMLQTVGGCTHIKGIILGNQELDDARQLMLKGDTQTALAKYEDILKHFPEVGDQALFPMGIFYTRADGTKANYQKALGYFQRLLKEYPDSRFREETNLLTLLILEILNRDERIRMSESRTDTLEKKANSLEKKANAFEMQIEKMKEIDKNLEAKKRRRIPQR
ncbi:MAG: tetratricopeptide repeat protein [Syntrophales bacterium]|nr:tetratricopeptide repeat protein [Syntrophales bacterium]